MGRPVSVHPADYVDEICQLIASGCSLVEVCRKDKMPHRATVHQWIVENRDGFGDKYADARAAQAEHYADEIVALSDSVRGCGDPVEVNAARLQIDSRKWVASKLLPKKYGDRVVTEVTGKDGKDLIPAEPDVSKVALSIMALLEAAKREKS